MGTAQRGELLLITGAALMMAGAAIAWLARSPVVGMVVPLVGFALLLAAGLRTRPFVRQWQIKTLTVAGIVGLVAMIAFQDSRLALALGFDGTLLLLAAVLADAWRGSAVA